MAKTLVLCEFPKRRGTYLAIEETREGGGGKITPIARFRNQSCHDEFVEWARNHPGINYTDERMDA